MAGIRCDCGWILKDTAAPNDIQFWVHTDDTSLKINKINDYQELLDSYDFEVWRCTECDRLHVFDRQFRHVKTYKAEKNPSR